MKPTAAHWLAAGPIKAWNAEQLACLPFLSFFIYSNLIAIFQRGMTRWKRPSKISIIWITIYKLLTKHLHLLICDFDIKVRPGNIMRMEKGRLISGAVLLPLFFCLCVHLYHGNSEQSWILATSASADLRNISGDFARVDVLDGTNIVAAVFAN